MIFFGLSAKHFADLQQKLSVGVLETSIARLEEHFGNFFEKNFIRFFGPWAKVFGRVGKAATAFYVSRGTFWGLTFQPKWSLSRRIGKSCRKNQHTWKYNWEFNFDYDATPEQTWLLSWLLFSLYEITSQCWTSRPNKIAFSGSYHNCYQRNTLS